MTTNQEVAQEGKLGDGSPIGKREYQWDYYGDCDPAHRKPHGYETFSVGVFQWLPKSSGKGLKKGNVQSRVSGSVNSPQEVYDKAIANIQKMESVQLTLKKHDICKNLNKGI